MEQEPQEKKRILVVEDFDVVREMIASFVRAQGYEAETAANGSVGFELFCSHRFDLVITDLEMPGGNGLELISRIREQKADLPVVVITSAPELMNTIAYRADAVLMKPFDTKKLDAILQKLLGSQRNGFS